MAQNRHTLLRAEEVNAGHRRILCFPIARQTVRTQRASLKPEDFGRGEVNGPKEKEATEFLRYNDALRRPISNRNIVVFKKVVNSALLSSEPPPFFTSGAQTAWNV
jgi:hypothetical protein